MAHLKQFYDVVIVGAGPVGRLLACALSKSKYLGDILLLDKCPKPNQSLDSVPSQRVYSINASTMKLFESLRLPIDTTRIGVTNTVKVWNDDGLLEFTDPQIGRVVEDGNITRALEEVRGNTDVHYDSQLKDYEVHSKKVNVLLDCGHRFSTKLLVGSDGNTTMIKDTAKINTYGWHENRMGIVCTLKLNQTITTAYQRYKDGNILAILPLWGNYASIVWSVEKPFAEYLMKNSDHQFMKNLVQFINKDGSHNPSDMPQIEEILNQRMAFPISTLQSDRYALDRVALIGDAAHLIHPMAGLGINSGFSDAALLANSIILNKKTGNDHGEAIALKRFQVQAKKLNLSNSVAMEGIKKMFEVSNAPLNALRGFTMNLLQESQAAKNILISASKKNPFFPDTFEWELQQ